MTRRLILVLVFFAGLVGGVGYALSHGSTPPHDRLTPDAAHAEARAGERLLIDIRTPAEWAATGVPEGAVTLDFKASGEGPAFVDGVLALTDGDRGRPIALICARGNRSGRAWRLLHEAAFGDVKDVAEGMLGNDLGPGWLGRGLPTRPWSSR